MNYGGLLLPGALAPQQSPLLMCSDISVVIVDSDAQNLLNLGLMFQQCGYNNVTYLQTPEEALWLLQQTPVDILMCEAFLPTTNNNNITDDVVDDGGFQLLSAVRELNFSSVQVVLFSNHRVMGLGHEVAIRALELSACTFYWKPISMELVRHLWQHVFVKKIQSCNGITPLPPSVSTNLGPKSSSSCNNSEEVEVRIRKVMKKSKGCSMDDATTLKKQRIRWTKDLERKFDAAVDAIRRTEHEVTPKRILALMKGMGEELAGLTAPQISSHLQKYKKKMNT